MAAAEIARSSSGWSALADAGADDAAEAVRAAWRAREAAERAERAATPAEAMDHARLAWAAAASALEADGRVIAAIAEELAAA
jgi:hypothetical protein